MRLSTLFFMLLSTACRPDAPTDGDGDGFAPGSDCNDANAAVFPGATETCNGIDDNCEGGVDEGERTPFHVDADGDGAGDPEMVVEACGPSLYWVDDAGDCNDSDALVWPGANEICNGLDDDCDGEIDEGLGHTWNADADGDGFGDPLAPLVACDDVGTAPAGFTDDSSDCDDANDDVHPAAAERCNGSDDDCDALTDEDLFFQDWWLDQDEDGYGDALNPRRVCSEVANPKPPSGYADAPGDCDDGDAAVNSDATETCNGVDNDCDGAIDEDLLHTAYVDEDEDGYGNLLQPEVLCIEGDGSLPTGFAEDAGDCDDGESDVHPEAEESCNGTDDDCDGEIDEKLRSTFYEDADGDTFGDSLAPWVTCGEAPPTGFVDDDQDCDDDDDEVYPEALEACNGIDDDCDGDVDEDAAGGDTWFFDADGDEHGSMAESVVSCHRPAGWVEIGDDCDDTSALAWPGNDEECDGIDNDCSGEVDDGASGGSEWYVDLDQDGFRDVTRFPVVSCGKPGAAYTASTEVDCDDTTQLRYPGNPEVCDGLDNDCVGGVDDAAMDALTWYADEDEDGYGDPGEPLYSCDEDAPDGWVEDASDCDDGATEVNPYGDEVCDGQDNDCDGAIDEEDSSLDPGTLSSFKVDADRDGFGTDETTERCGQGAGVSTVSGDCADADPLVNPDVPELCNGIDDNCDDEVDEDVGTSWFLDLDADGFGTIVGAVVACENPDPGGRVARGGDCDETNPTRNPETAWILDEDADGFGTRIATLNQCENPGAGWLLDDGLLDEDCDDDRADIWPGAPEVCFAEVSEYYGYDTIGKEGADNDCDGTVDEDCGEPLCKVPEMLPDDELVLSANGVGWDVVCDLTIDGGTFRVEPGAVVRFATGKSMKVGAYAPTSVDIDGAVFTSASATPVAGDWAGITFGTDAAGAMRNSELAFAGAATANAVTSEYNDMELSGNDIHDVLGRGLYLRLTTATVKDNTLTDIGAEGIQCFAAPCFADGDATVSGNTVVRSAKHGLVVLADQVVSIDWATTTLDEIGTFPVRVQGGIVSKTQEWAALPDFHVTADLYVQGPLDDSDPPQPPRLTVSDMTLFFDKAKELIVGKSDAGAVDLTNVVLTSAEAVPAPSDWDGPSFYAGTAESTLDGVTVEYSISTWLADDVPVTVKDSLLRYNDVGLEVDDGGGIATDNEIRHNVVGVEVGGRGFDEFSGNLVLENEEAPLEGAPNALGTIGVNDFLGDDTANEGAGERNGLERIEVWGGSVVDTQTWLTHQVPYYVSGTVKLAGPASAPAELTLEPDAHLTFAPYTGLEIGWNAGEWGTLLATGSSLFDNATGVGAGNWEGLRIGSRGEADLVGAEVTGAGEDSVAARAGAVYVNAGTMSCKQCDLHDNRQNGITMNYGKLDLIDSSIHHTRADNPTAPANGSALRMIASPVIALEDNEFKYNDYYPMVVEQMWGPLALGAIQGGNDYRHYADDDPDAEDWPYDSIYVGGGSVSVSAVVEETNVPLFIASGIRIGYNQWDHAVVEVYGGTWMMAPNANIHVGTHSFEYMGKGDFYADGVTFQSSKQFPDRGDWQQIRFGLSSGALSGLIGCTIKHAGGAQTDTCNLCYRGNCAPGCTAVLLEPSSGADLIDNTFDQNTNACIIALASNGTLTGNLTNPYVDSDGNTVKRCTGNNLGNPNYTNLSYW